MSTVAQAGSVQAASSAVPAMPWRHARRTMDMRLDARTRTSKRNARRRKNRAENIENTRFFVRLYFCNFLFQNHWCLP
jgi:hypothetical protein